MMHCNIAVYQVLVVVAIIIMSLDGVIMTCAWFIGVKVLGRLLPPQSGKK